MQKEIFDKVGLGMVLSPNDLTAAEKKQLYTAMEKRGSSEAFAYTRFFRDGFAQWELEGVWKAKAEYLQLLHTKGAIAIEVRRTETIPHPEGDICKYRHFYRTLDGNEGSFDITKKGDFWQFLGNIHHRIHFGVYMAALGMRSQTTVAKRFSVDNWKDYELDGVQQVINSLFNNIDYD